MPKSLLSNKTTRRPKEPFDPALEAPVVLTPDDLETVVGGLGTLAVQPLSGGNAGGATTGAKMPRLKL